MFYKTAEPMVKTSNQVHTTTDYFLFKPIDGNRNKNVLHLKRLKQSMEQNYLFTVIIVNENYEIIDGQHRFEIIRELELPLNYIVCEGYGLNEVHVLNANSKNWAFDDYLNGYCNLGYKDYIIYRDFKNKYGYQHQICQRLLYGQSNGDTSKVFQAGKFKVNHFSEAVKYAEMIPLVKPYYTGYTRQGFVLALLTVLKNPNFSFNEFLRKLEIQPTSLKDCAKVQGYIALIEDIYNYHRKEKINLRYSK